jgi:hypothetical protein
MQLVGGKEDGILNFALLLPLVLQPPSWRQSTGDSGESPSDR